MKIQRRTLYSIWETKDLTRAVAMSLLIHEKLSDITIRNWSYSRLSAISHISYRTTKKYLNLLIRHDMARIDGNNLIFPSLKSKHDERNVMVKVFKNDTVNDVAVKLRLMFINIKNQQKHYVKSVIGKSVPSDINEVKRNRRIARKLGLIGRDFNDNGISMGRMTRALNISRRTVVNQLNYAESKGWIKRILRDVRVFAQHVPDDLFPTLFRSFHTYKDGYAIKYLPSYYLLSPMYLTSDQGASSLTGHRYTSSHITYYRTLQPSGQTPTPRQSPNIGW